MKSNIIALHRWEIYEFPWGTAVKEQRSGKWIRAFIKSSGQEIDLSETHVILHVNGIEFIKH